MRSDGFTRRHILLHHLFTPRNHPFNRTAHIAIPQRARNRLNPRSSLTQVHRRRSRRVHVIEPLARKLINLHRARKRLPSRIELHRERKRRGYRNRRRTAHVHVANRVPYLIARGDWNVLCVLRQRELIEELERAARVLDRLERERRHDEGNNVGSGGGGGAERACARVRGRRRGRWVRDEHWRLKSAARAPLAGARLPRTRARTGADGRRHGCVRVRAHRRARARG